MQDKASSPSLSDLLSLRLGVVLRDEDDYQRIYENRIRRFTAMQRAGGEFGPRAEETIKITADAREVAEVLRTELEACAAAAARRRAEMIELVITADRRFIARAETPSAVAESLRPLEEKAYDFLRSLANADESVFGERSVAEVLRERFAEESEEHRDLISGITARLIMMWQSEGQRAKILSILVQLGRIYRGLFYVGVLKATGGALERDALKASLSDFLVEIGGIPLPGLGFIVAAAKFVNFIEPDESLDVVKKANALASFLTGYAAILNEWGTAARSLADALRRARESGIEHAA